ncbi:bifunctional 3-demethylubiquinone-9 3-methyltransferase/ 2-octaprenyl-6-hydroxy phenol methylase [Serratia quinivorans]|uniref:class I SAM-dependent methyltransferase n=1 Tax=Serratia quinivorans TaxID=137545 RepID=UPI00217ACC2E|nr:class I SAM-dependent methyltransferase [Serratia quinivorans]CAI1813025.1 bifunctional 3-demethylubiquinone-9 3-methyltransferase/ 2-octaprenyl-6-hydroxy phenol methylase [Serratia quinivorans]
MSIKISGGVKEEGIVVGNAYDKYGSRNPIVKWMMDGFESALSNFINETAPLSIHEVGCGEGYWVLRWNKEGLNARGCDFSNHCIDIAKENAISHEVPPSQFEVCSIYDLDKERDVADLIVCCEVLEHLEDPVAGLMALQRVVGKHLIISVPREPLWCGLNLARGQYVSQWGNTPGHLQHWSKSAFIQLVSKYFEIEKVKSPLPWTMLLCRPFDL